MSIPLRHWATPLVVGAFALMAVTGTTLFFHVNSGLAKGMHEWAGWALLAGAGAHLAVNWRALKVYFRRPLALAIMGSGLAITAATLLPVGPAAEVGGPAAVLSAVAAAPVPVLAQLSRQTEAEVVADLVAAGFADATAHSTITELAAGDFGRSIGAMEAVLAAD